jgi:hypothetical protein
MPDVGPVTLDRMQDDHGQRDYGDGDDQPGGQDGTAPETPFFRAGQELTFGSADVAGKDEAVRVVPDGMGCRGPARRRCG